MKKTIISIVGLLSIGTISYIIYHNHIIPTANTTIPTSTTINQESEYPVVENEHISYGPITGNTIITYTGKTIAHIESGYITYFSGIIKIPSDLTGWMYPSDGAHNNVIFLNSEYGPTGEETNYSGKQMIFIYGPNKLKQSLKETCYKDNKPEPGGKVADYIEQNLHEINGINIYFSYTEYNEGPFHTGGGLCTIINGNILMIWIQNYSKEKIYSILNSFHFIN